MVLLNKIGEIVMEQLQKDRNYTGFLIRLIRNEVNSNRFKTRNDLIMFINKINSDLSTVEIANYIRDNGLTFNNQEFNMNINKILQEYDMRNQMQNVVPLTTNQQQTNTGVPTLNNQNVGAITNNVQSIHTEPVQYVPITKIDFNKVSKELIEKVNFIIVNPNVNTNDFMVDLVSGNFKNIKDNNIYVVNKNINNGSFELVPKNTIKVRQEHKVENYDVQTNSIPNNLSMFSDEQLQTLINNPNISDVNRKAFSGELEKRGKEVVKEKSDVKVKTKVKQEDSKLMPQIDNKAFASTVLLTLMSAIFGVVIASILIAS